MTQMHAGDIIVIDSKLFKQCITFTFRMTFINCTIAVESDHYEGHAVGGVLISTL